MVLVFDIVTLALPFGEKGLTFSYDTQCRKEGAIQNKIYTTYKRVRIKWLTTW